MQSVADAPSLITAIMPATGEEGSVAFVTVPLMVDFPALGNRAAASVPLLMFEALVVSVVAEAAGVEPLIFATVGLG